MIRNGRSQKEVAAIIGVSESTVSRELRRDGMDRTCYSCKRAEDHARSRPWFCYRVRGDLFDQVEARLREDWSPVEVGAAILGSMRGLEDKVLTLTYDNGKEFALHKLIGELLGADGSFAHPYHSWERGLNENTNGLIRQYFPKGCDLKTFSPAQVAAAQDILNSRPRKCLDYQTPNDIFHMPSPIALAA